MGSRYLTDLADVCRRTGYPVIEEGGWQTRARGSGGYDSGRPNHIMVHHTASGPSSDGWPDVNYCTYGDEDAPLCNLYLARDGTIWVCAGGATNTNGSGHDPCGVTADDSMNSSAIGIEAGNDGVGERWPDVMLDSYARLCAELCDAYGIPNGRIHAHFEWAPTRKTDPAGPDRYASGAASWDMAGFRSDCAGAPEPAPEPDPGPEPPEEDDVKFYVVAHPTDGKWYLTDMATFRTHVTEPGLASEGAQLWGWGTADGNGAPWGVGPGWGPYLDQLPETCP